MSLRRVAGMTRRGPPTGTRLAPGPVSGRPLLPPNLKLKRCGPTRRDIRAAGPHPGRRLNLSASGSGGGAWKQHQPKWKLAGLGDGTTLTRSPPSEATATATANGGGGCKAAIRVRQTFAGLKPVGCPLVRLVYRKFFALWLPQCSFELTCSSAANQAPFGRTRNLLSVCETNSNSN